MSSLEAAHQLRLQQLLESGRLTPAASPTPEQQIVQPQTPPKRVGKKRGASKLNLEAVAESTPQYLPDAMNFIVCVSSRSPDVGLENDHNLHCLCSFPTRQHAHDWIVKHRLALARHYLMDSRLTTEELEAAAKEDGCQDEYYLGEHVSMEILAVPHYSKVETAPNPAVPNLLFDDHFMTNRIEEDAEEEHKSDEGEEAEPASGGKGKKRSAKQPATKKAKHESA